MGKKDRVRAGQLEFSVLDVLTHVIPDHTTSPLDELSMEEFDSVALVRTKVAVDGGRNLKLRIESEGTNAVLLCVEDFKVGPLGFGFARIVGRILQRRKR